MMNSTNEIVEDDGVYPYMVCEIEFQDEDALNAF